MTAIKTTTEFVKAIEKVVSAGVKNRDAFRELAEEAVSFMLADGPSRNDTGRINTVLDAAERVSYVNTTALAAWFREYTPVSIALSKETGVYIAKYNKKLASDFNYEAADYLGVPFWSFRKQTEKTEFVLDKTVHSFVSRLVKNGVTLAQMQEALSVEFAKVAGVKEPVAVAE